MGFESNSDSIWDGTNPRHHIFDDYVK